MWLGELLALAPWQLTVSKNTQSREDTERADSILSACGKVLIVSADGNRGPMSVTANSEHISFTQLVSFISYFSLSKFLTDDLHAWRFSAAI